MRARVCFASAIACSDEFLDLPFVCQAFYLYLAFVADNDGFIDGMKRIARGFGITMEEVQKLVEAGLLMVVDGTYLITHWKCNNKTDNANYHPGTHINTLEKYVVVENNKPYRLKTDCQQSDGSQGTDVNINTHDILESSPSESSPTEPCCGQAERKVEYVFQDPPTFEEVEQYVIDEGLTFVGDGCGTLEQWYDSHVSRGWVNKHGEPLKISVLNHDTGEVMSGWQLYLHKLNEKMERDAERAYGDVSRDPANDHRPEPTAQRPEPDDVPEFDLPEGAEVNGRCMCFTAGCRAECHTFKWHGATYYHCAEHGNLMYTDRHGNRVNQQQNQWSLMGSG